MNDFFLTRVRYSRLRIKNDLFMWYSFVFLIFTLKSCSVQSKCSVKICDWLQRLNTSFLHFAVIFFYNMDKHIVHARNHFLEGNDFKLIHEYF